MTTKYYMHPGKGEVDTEENWKASYEQSKQEDNLEFWWGYELEEGEEYPEDWCHDLIEVRKAETEDEKEEFGDWVEVEVN